MPLTPPAETYSEDFYRFHWADLGVECLMERFIERQDDIAVELTVNLDHPLYGGQLYSGRLLLLGPNSRRDVRNALNARLPDEIDWGGILEKVCTLARDRFRRGEPAVDLTQVDHKGRPQFLYEPFIVSNGISIPYGDGKTAKSLFILRLCVLLALHKGMPSLYLDWEDDAETHAMRLDAICAGLGVDKDSLVGMIHYQRRTVRLAESVREIRRVIAEKGVQHVVIDSLGMAAGDPNNHDLMIEAVRAARSLGVATSCIHHLPKDAKDKTKPFGSVYASNEARLTWLFEKSQEEDSDELSIVLTNQAFNRGRLQGKQAYKVRFTNNEDELVCVEFDAVDVGQVQAFRHKLPQWRLIRDALVANGLLGPKEIATVLQADNIEVSEAAVRALLKRHEGKVFIRRERGLWGALEQSNTQSNKGPI